ncbi:MAG: YggT family protein [Burkholderiaceae bacterium]
MLIEFAWILAKALFSLVCIASMLRAYLLWLRMPPMNPVSQLVFRVTNWIVLPIRRLMPSSQFDWASLLAAWLLALLAVLFRLVLAAFEAPVLGLPQGLTYGLLVLGLSLTWMMGWALKFAFVLLVVHALLSWFGAGPSAMAMRPLVTQMTEPCLRPLRQLVHRGQPTGIDFSPLAALILIQLLLSLNDRAAQALLTGLAL